jgi:hypothetical protein
MKIHLLGVSNHPLSKSCVEDFARLPRASRSKKHTLCDSPDDADLILVVDFHLMLDNPLMRPFYTHPVVKKHGPRVFAWDQRPVNWLTCAGVAVSTEKRWLQSEFQAPFMYYFLRHPYIENLDGPILELPENRTPQFLASFTGARSHPLREAIFGIQDPRFSVRHISFRDNPQYDAATAKSLAQRTYIESMTDAKFVLCPRGRATSSYRLYETMALGRAPVILADEWAAPSGVDWEACSIRIPEAQIPHLPELLRPYEDRWAEMGAAARRAWENSLSAEVRFDRAIELCTPVMEKGNGGPRPLAFSHPAFRKSLAMALHRRAGQTKKAVKKRIKR